MNRKAAILCAASLTTLALTSASAKAQTSTTQPPPAQGEPAPAQEGSDIVVTGIRAAITEAIDIRRESVQIVDSVVAEDVGKLPDNNVVEALQRVTGIQVTNRGAGEASGISIRGLPDALTTMNGRNIFTASGRAFALQDIPANLVRRIDVYKTRAAEQIETGIAGQIDVFTRRPFDFDDFAISGVARGIYNEQADSYNPNLSALISKRWETGIGDVGILINGSYAKTDFREQSVTAGAMVPFVTENPPPGFAPLQRVFPETGAWQPGTELGLPTEPGSTFLLNGQQVPYYLSRDAVFSPDVAGKRTRPAVNAALQWSPNSSSTYTFEFFWNQFEQTTFNNLFFSFVDFWGALGPNPGSTFELFDGTNIIKSRRAGDVFGFNSGDYNRSKTDSFVYALNGKWETIDGGRINADLSYQNSEFNSQFLAMRISRVASMIDVDFNANDGIPAYNFNDNALLTDPSQWDVGEFFDNANRSRGDAMTGHLDYEKEFDAGFLRKFKTGIRYDNRSAMDSVREQSAGGLGVGFETLDPGLVFQNDDFYQGRANVPTSWIAPNGYYIAQNTDAIRSLYNLPLSGDLSLTDIFDINEVSMAAYVQGDFEVDLFGRPLQIQAGARYVDVDTDLVFTDRISGVTTSGSQTTSRLLPSATLRYELFDNFRIRFNYGQTLRRPGFADLNPNLNLVGDLTGIGRGSGSGGNVDLQPTTSKNYDLALEWYFARDSAIYTTVFRREIEGLVVPITSLIEFATPPLNDAAQTTRFGITRPENASNGVLEGIEVGVTLFPRLPGIFNGFGLQGSLTLLDSSQNIPLTDSAGNITGQTESAFFGVSDLSYNVTAAYERGPVGARLSYVWRKEFLANNEARLFANPIGVWRRPESSLDFQLTIAATPRLGITFDAVNLTNEVQQNYYRFGDAGGPQTHNLGTTLLPRTFALGVRYSFDR
ncbi:TonB-dependent receptor [Sphingomonas sp. AX6]|uniref:TonB-dependent receptor n=1 Tax=Sphingomonas sp. AX6 TaxID=2653171 RepID=UPI0012F34CB9|nr:TonB-dependent receptor [Sphingomonas sp. AX6]VXC78874.1 TonB-dependent receptor [Sphingomonas sp. AX6]